MYSSLCPVLNSSRHKAKHIVSVVLSSLRYLSHVNKTPTFGLLIDVDGVIVQGNKVIPGVKDAFKKLTSSGGDFILPTVFVTNSANTLTEEKAKHLSDWLNVLVPEEHVVCSHDPFRIFETFHDKNVLITGQKRAEEIAKSVGFKRIVTVDDILKVFPMLDAMELTRRVSALIPEDVEFSPVEAIVLLGEPVRWEAVLQVLMDILLTNGDPRKIRLDYPFPHIPVMACNMDLQWKFTCQIPRMAHGTFINCLENVYQKVTGKHLEYHAMVGKPSVVTYKYALRLIMKQAKALGVEKNINSLYMIGDNINTDIFGANLYNDHLTSGEKDVHYDPSTDLESPVKKCQSVLVKTGVSSEELFQQQINHVHRDFLRYDKAHRSPTHLSKDFSNAIDLIFKLEKFH